MMHAYLIDAFVILFGIAGLLISAVSLICRHDTTSQE